ncbi:hypothetical protein [Burkholderia multivorans]|uniref:hypothetical protein n=1 Tax=Burkholderia multivorans TaxID=87883 RepID=UPI0020B1C516|nr:hypothetical protein [Burkholderia multivorans]MDN7607727.1 hypothetical protein [Burkholderia multivorans]
MTSKDEKFDFLVANLLADLYKKFPKATDISSGAYGIRAEEMFLFDGTVDKDIADELDFFCNTLRWLKRYGYIDYSAEYDSGTFVNVAITTKALGARKSTPESLKASKSLRDEVADSAEAVLRMHSNKA